MQSFTSDSLRRHWMALRENNPTLRIRDAAEELGTSEGQLVALETGTSSTRLNNHLPGLLQALHRLGPLMGLTRNDHAVHEAHARYQNLKIVGRALLVEDAGVSAALFLDHWKFAFARTEMARGQARHSLQFFDKGGDAVHKIYLTEQSDLDSFSDLIETFRADDQSDVLDVASQVSQENPRLKPHDLWSKHLLSDWPEPSSGSAITVPDLCLNSASVTVEALPDMIIEALLQEASKQAIPLIIAVGNRGAVQMFRGPIEKVLRTGPWINVLDETFNLHLRDTQIATGWLVREKAEEATISLCWFDEKGQLILQIFIEDPASLWKTWLKEAAHPTKGTSS